MEQLLPGGWAWGRSRADPEGMAGAAKLGTGSALVLYDFRNPKPGHRDT